MDWVAIIDQLGGGVSAVALAGVAYLYWSERQENRRLNEARHKDSAIMIKVMEQSTSAHRESTETQKETVKAVALLRDHILAGDRK